MSTKDTPKPVAEVCSGWTIRWVGSEPIATILGRNPSVRIGTMLFDQATIDAAVAAERERIALAWDGCRHEGMPCDMDIGASIRAGELVRWVGGA